MQRRGSGMTLGRKREKKRNERLDFFFFNVDSVEELVVEKKEF